jgi:hypothetical protein
MIRNTIVLAAAVLVGAAGCGNEANIQPAQASEEQQRMLQEEANKIAGEERSHMIQNRKQEMRERNSVHEEELRHRQGRP